MRLLNYLSASCAALLVSLTGLNASTTVTESFSSAAQGSSLPAGWFATDPDHVRIQSIAGTPFLQIYRGVPEGSSAVYYSGNGGSNVFQPIQDLSMEVTVRMGNTLGATTLRGVVLRAQSATLSAPSASSFWGYSIGFIATGANRGIHIYENPTSVYSSGSGTLLASSAFASDLEAQVEYIFRVVADGKNLLASLYSSDGNTLISSVSYDNAIVVSGGFGLRSANGNGNVNTNYRDLTMTYTVPEAKHVALMVGGAALGLVVLLRRRVR